MDKVIKVLNPINMAPNAYKNDKKTKILNICFAVSNEK